MFSPDCYLIKQKTTEMLIKTIFILFFTKLCVTSDLKRNREELFQKKNHIQNDDVFHEQIVTSVAGNDDYFAYNEGKRLYSVIQIKFYDIVDQIIS